MLGLPEDCRDLETIKDAYKRKAKLFHPDSSSEFANKEKFTQLVEAYSHLQTSLSNGIEAGNDEEKDKEESKLEFDIRHTAPQHRQYLEFGGKGYGTPSARQKQFQQMRRQEATERVFEYRQKKFGNPDETALTMPDKKKAKDIRVSNAIERLVEDLILESMRKGEFSNLKGYGKPLSVQNYHHFIDTTTIKINEIIIQDGFKPEWIELEKEIRQQISQIRRQLTSLHDEIAPTPTLPPSSSPPTSALPSSLPSRTPMTTSTSNRDDTNPSPSVLLSAVDELRWNRQCCQFRVLIRDINQKIDKFNLIVPILTRQLTHYDAEREIQRIQQRIPVKRNPAAMTLDSSPQTRPSQPGGMQQFMFYLNSLFSRIKND